MIIFSYFSQDFITLSIQLETLIFNQEINQQTTLGMIENGLKLLKNLHVWSKLVIFWSFFCHFLVKSCQK